MKTFQSILVSAATVTAFTAPPAPNAVLVYPSKLNNTCDLMGHIGSVVGTFTMFFQSDIISYGGSFLRDAFSRPDVWGRVNAYIDYPAAEGFQYPKQCPAIYSLTADVVETAAKLMGGNEDIGSTLKEAGGQLEAYLMALDGDKLADKYGITYEDMLSHANSIPVSAIGAMMPACGPAPFSTEIFADKSINLGTSLKTLIPQAIPVILEIGGKIKECDDCLLNFYDKVIDLLDLEEHEADDAEEIRDALEDIIELALSKYTVLCDKLEDLNTYKLPNGQTLGELLDGEITMVELFSRIWASYGGDLLDLISGGQDAVEVDGKTIDISKLKEVDFNAGLKNVLAFFDMIAAEVTAEGDVETNLTDDFKALIEQLGC